VETGDVRQVTRGDFDVYDPTVSRDGRTWFFSSSEESPFVRHFYRMPIEGGRRVRMSERIDEAALNPDEETLAVLRSSTNQPPEIFLDGERVTQSPTAEWLSYAWRDPEIITFEASDGIGVPAHVFVPENPNGAAVVFVHGAGYLQNVHRGWSENYYREYMFHNLLADEGYYVMNVDFRGSAGYGRGWRTAVYRHMGGRDLQDYVDASRFLAAEHGIDSERVFIYGGSYGGFITLMALFTEPEHFGGGAALRSVTDWAHYHHGYTANILNTPAEDTLAFRQSSPINFAEGLEDPLLIAHGMMDDNVQFQDVVRLAQRLIELGKEDWELAVYPLERHSFEEPESWADEYRRILKYIRLSVGR
jgi:dipeptidyl aminopeptidase/acylaminoacyl peptidase